MVGLFKVGLWLQSARVGFLKWVCDCLLEVYEGLLEVNEDMVEVFLVLEIFLTEDS